jgi:hypothetical protein
LRDCCTETILFPSSLTIKRIWHERWRVHIERWERRAGPLLRPSRPVFAGQRPAGRCRPARNLRGGRKIVPNAE